MSAQPCGKDLEVMVNDAIAKEQMLWKPLELNVIKHKPGSSVTEEHRADVLEWLSLVAIKFQFYPEAPALAVSILDKFLSSVKVQLKYLNCVALACLYISSKLTEEDEMVPSIADLVSQSSANCSTDDIVRMERLILTKLDWDVNLTTPLHFLQVCHAKLQVENPDLLSSVSSHMTPDRQLALLTHKLQVCMQSAGSGQWSPSMVAVSLLSLELEQFRADWFPLTLSLLKFIKRVNYSELILCKERLSAHLLSLMVAHSRQQAESSRQHKRSRHNTDVSSKRKMTAPPLDQDDIYSSIKGLYNEDEVGEPHDPASIAAKLCSED